MNPTLAELRARPKSVEIQQYLAQKLSQKRFQHVLSVQELTLELAQIHGVDVWHATLAALLHDSAKWMSPRELYSNVERYQIRLDPIEERNPALLHPIIGVKLAVEQFAVTELEILEAIRNHTTGSPSMGTLSQVLYVADFAEPTRTYQGADVARDLAATDLKRAVHYVAGVKIADLLKKGVLIHPNTLHTYNRTSEAFKTIGGDPEPPDRD